MAIIDLTHNSPEILDMLNELLARTDDLSDAMAGVAAVLESAVEGAFADEADPETGTAWDALSAVTLGLRPHRAGGQLLQDSGRLAASITSDSGADFAQVGTNAIYAGTMQFGAARGAFGKSSRGTPLPWGDIPARPFMGISPDDESDILAILSDHLSGPLAP